MSKKRDRPGLARESGEGGGKRREEESGRWLLPAERFQSGLEGVR